MVKMPDRRQRRREDHIIMYNHEISVALVCMGKPIGREKTRVRTHVRRSWFVRELAP